MIVNVNSLPNLQAEWQGAIRMRERIQQLVISTFAFDPTTSPAFGNVLYNLPFLLAFDVLKHVLLEAKEDGQFTGSGHRLSELMDSAKSSLPWIDWRRLKEAVKRRNEAAHDGKLVGDAQCLQDIADIEVQLLAWGVLRPESK